MGQLYLNKESVLVVKTKIGSMTNTTDLALNLSTTSWTIFSVFLSSVFLRMVVLSRVLAASTE